MSILPKFFGSRVQYGTAYVYKFQFHRRHTIALSSFRRLNLCKNSTHTPSKTQSCSRKIVAVSKIYGSTSVPIPTIQLYLWIRTKMTCSSVKIFLKATVTRRATTTPPHPPLLSLQAMADFPKDRTRS